MLICVCFYSSFYLHVCFLYMWVCARVPVDICLIKREPNQLYWVCVVSVTPHLHGDLSLQHCERCHVLLKHACSINRDGSGDSFSCH